MYALFRLSQNEHGETHAHSIDRDWTPALQVLESRPHPDYPSLAEVFVNGAWRRNSSWYRACRGCGPYVWVGWKVGRTWFVRGKCPKCNHETGTMPLDYREPRPGPIK